MSLSPDRRRRGGPPEDESQAQPDDSNSLTGRHEQRINEVYEWLHILNDLLIGLYFLVGSIMFFYPHWENTGIWLFILGSAQMLIGPVIRTLNKLHVRRVAKKVLHY